MYRVFLSWRYLFARRTNLIGIVGITVAVGALILILSIMTGFLEETRRAVRGSLADVIVQPYQGGSVSASTGPLLTAIREDERVRSATAQLVWGGIITERGRTLDRLFSSQSQTNPLVVQLVGVDVAGALRVGWPAVRVAFALVGVHVGPLAIQDELSTTEFLAAITGSHGRSPSAPVANPLFPFAPPDDYRPEGRPKASLLLGEQFFSSLGFRVGDVLQLNTVVRDPASGEYRPNNRKFVVAGSFRTGQNETDFGRVYLDRRELADFMGHSLEFSQVLLKLRDFDRTADGLVADMRSSLAEERLVDGRPLRLIQGTGGAADREVRTWAEVRGNLLGAIENERVLMGIMLSLVLLVAGFTIFAILSMMVTEKRRDIGILLALGATQRGILGVFLLISFWDALLGAALGTTLGVWGALKIDPLERALSDAFGIEIFRRDVYLFEHIPSVVVPIAVVAIVLGAFTCALLCAAVPAWRAGRMEPLEALRYE